LAEVFLDDKIVSKAREAALQIAKDVVKEINSKTTIAVERAVVRLLGIEGETSDGVPWVNVITDKMLAHKLLDRGAAYWLVNAAIMTERSLQEVAEDVIFGKLDLTKVPKSNRQQLNRMMDLLAEEGLEKITTVRSQRAALRAQLGKGEEPLKYVIVATGNIYEDVVQAKAAVSQGADIIAVIRHTAQSLLDYVPSGTETEGVGGTLATKENFQVMRQALDKAGREAGRYIYLTNYCSGLCMPEMAILGAIEGLDIMLNDSMYGVIFRDINMSRTFIDQHFSRAILGFADVNINTGEDNYLTTADAYDKAHTVTASQFINEQFAILSGMVPEQIGLGHAFEICPDKADSFLYELAQAQMVRQLFPKSPVKYMPPTKYMTGNIFQGNVQNALFNAASAITHQSVHLLGMPTEAIHTPHLQDRYLSIANTNYVFHALKHFGDEIEFAADGIIQRRAAEVLANALDMLEEVANIGLMTAISKGMFADIARQVDGGKGLDGVVEKADDYLNPFENMLKEKGGKG